MKTRNGLNFELQKTVSGIIHLEIVNIKTDGELYWDNQ